MENLDPFHAITESSPTKVTPAANSYANSGSIFQPPNRGFNTSPSFNPSFNPILQSTTQIPNMSLLQNIETHNFDFQYNHLQTPRIMASLADTGPPNLAPKLLGNPFTLQNFNSPLQTNLQNIHPLFHHNTFPAFRGALVEQLPECFNANIIPKVDINPVVLNHLQANMYQKFFPSIDPPRALDFNPIATETQLLRMLLESINQNTSNIDYFRRNQSDNHQYLGIHNEHILPQHLYTARCQTELNQEKPEAGEHLQLTNSQIPEITRRQKDEWLLSLRRFNDIFKFSLKEHK
jgi:hypothetical protein